MPELLDHPAFQAAVLPFLAALAAAALLRRTAALGLAVGAGFMAMVAATIGFSFEPMTSQRKLVLLAAAVVALVPLLEAIPKQRRKWAARALAVAAAVSGVWLVLRVLQQQEAGRALIGGAAAACYMAALVSSAQRTGGDTTHAAASSLGMGLATGALALLGASALLAQMGIAVAASAGAVLLVLAMAGHGAPSWTLALPAAMTCGLVGLLAVFTGALPWYCLLPVVAIPWAVRLAPVAGRAPWQAGALAGAAALVPASLSIVLAWLAAASAA